MNSKKMDVSGLYVWALMIWFVIISTQSVTTIFAAATLYVGMTIWRGRTALRLTMHSAWPLVILCVWGMVMGGLSSQFDAWAFTRDLIYIAKVPLIIFVTISLTLKVEQRDQALRAVFYAAFFLSVWYLFDYISNSGWAMERRQLRITVGRGYYLSFFGLMIVLFANSAIAKTRLSCLLLGGLGASAMVVAALASTSRGILLCPIFFVLVYAVYKMRFPFKLFLITSIVFVAIMSFPPTFKALEIFAYELDNDGINEMLATDFGSMEQIRASFRSFEAHVAWDQFLNLGGLRQLLGEGFGSLIGLGIFVELGVSKNSQSLTGEVPITHISMMTAMIKFGILGTVLYLYSLMPMAGTRRLAGQFGQMIVLFNHTSVVLCLFVIWTFQGYFSTLDINNVPIGMIALTLTFISQKETQTDA